MFNIRFQLQTLRREPPKLLRREGFPRSRGRSSLWIQAALACRGPRSSTGLACRLGRQTDRTGCQVALQSLLTSQRHSPFVSPAGAVRTASLSFSIASSFQISSGSMFRPRIMFERLLIPSATASL
uniref:Uncharacterized protein n=1 Tax=uncultured marine virus TaxID=186617 RepID=A0A0F7L2U3_9VIRU|nr:hypothetical protein [uncultured marine virus]